MSEESYGMRKRGVRTSLTGSQGSLIRQGWMLQVCGQVAIGAGKFISWPGLLLYQGVRKQQNSQPNEQFQFHYKTP
jgi:hypothetical protein